MVSENEAPRYIRQLTLRGIQDYPPRPNRGVIDYSQPVVFSHLDHFQARYANPTGPSHDGLFDLPFRNDWFRMNRPTAGIRRYRYGADLWPCGAFYWNDGRGEEQGLLIMSGQDCAILREKMRVTDDQWLPELLRGTHGVTRLDYAINITSGNPDDIKKEILAGRVKTRVREPREIGAIGKPGHSIYFGATTSEKMLRVYDKAAELKISDMVLTRIELQLRKKPAHRAARAMRSNGVKLIGKQAIRKFVDCPELQWWQRAVEGDDIDLQLTPSKETSFDRWLSEQVLPAIIKRIEARESMDAIETFTRAVLRAQGVLE